MTRFSHLMDSFLGMMIPLLYSNIIMMVHGHEMHVDDEIVFSPHSSKMPFAVSDVMATYMPGDQGDANGFVIITGGCDSPKGNERADFDPNLFVCTSTSSATLKFDPFTGVFTTLAAAPHERQRHAAVVMDNEVYVFGGRDTDDSIVTAVDSFDPTTNTWTTHGDLPTDLATSDLTAWTWGSYIYVTGGFQADYTAVGTTYRLNPSMNDGGSSWLDVSNIEMLSTSEHPRGDFHAVVVDGYAFLAGGITHTNDWCEGLKTTERYHMDSDTWQTLSDLAVGRADMAVAHWNGKIVAIGGETKPDDCVNVVDPAYGSFPVDHVEVLMHATGDSPHWVTFGDFHDERFRFAAAVVPAQNRVYTFGGQLPFDFTCDCFPASDLVGVGTEVLTQDDHGHPHDDDGSAGIIAATVLGVTGAVIVMGLLLRKWAQKRHKESLEKTNPVELEKAPKDVE